MMRMKRLTNMNLSTEDGLAVVMRKDVTSSEMRYRVSCYVFEFLNSTAADKAQVRQFLLENRECSLDEHVYPILVRIDTDSWNCHCLELLAEFKHITKRRTKNQQGVLE